MPKRPNVPPPPQEEIHEPEIGSAQQQHLDRPILMMPTPGLPQMGQPSFRPKQRIFRPPTTSSKCVNP
ncbi:hypothetical protein PIB30_067316 [Stylosanthes scabra]|uniref:Uncharacterized protein n=1 Tax=Stylosanthes scabra TaxID=79078 RepID=A0ABU6QNC9_9FABA|nr:hypothetical protein [Stylosanthes scabra]